jgi:hypothetical protein
MVHKMLKRIGDPNAMSPLKFMVGVSTEEISRS